MNELQIILERELGNPDNVPVSEDECGFEKWEREIYPRNWHLAYDSGEQARNNGLPRVCNLEGSPHCHNGNVLKVYKSAWEQGWDRYKIPAFFGQMEAHLNQMPLRPLKTEDI